MFGGFRVGILADFNPNNDSKKTPCFLAAGNVVHPPRQTDFGPCYPSLAHSPLITPLGHFDTAILSLSLNRRQEQDLRKRSRKAAQNTVGRQIRKRIGMQRFLMETELADFEAVEVVRLLCL